MTILKCVILIDNIYVKDAGCKIPPFYQNISFWNKYVKKTLTNLCLYIPVVKVCKALQKLQRVQRFWFFFLYTIVCPLSDLIFSIIKQVLWSRVISATNHRTLCNFLFQMLWDCFSCLITCGLSSCAYQTEKTESIMGSLPFPLNTNEGIPQM